MRDVTRESRMARNWQWFLLTRPMRDVTELFGRAVVVYIVSTHTPHAGRDVIFIPKKSDRRRFYSHAPCGT